MSTATLNGNRAIKARAMLPKWGIWHADVELDTEVELAGAVTLKIADLSLEGTVLAGGPQQGRSRFRMVGGKGGWGRTIKRKRYANDAGVKVSTVLVDAAQECGEVFDAASLPATRLGPHWTRIDGQASRLLELVAPSAWYVGEDGLTRLGARATAAWAGKATHEPVDRAAGVVVLAPETLGGLVPGAVVDGIVAVDVLHEVRSGKLRSTLWGSTGSGQTSRRLQAFRAILEQIFPALRYAGVFEYTIEGLEGDRLNLRPSRVSTGLPQLERVPVSPGVAGAKSTLVPGAVVYIVFVDGSPARPRVVGFEDADGQGFLPLTTKLDASTFVDLGAGAKPVIAAGDLAGIFPCVPTQVKVRV